MIIKTRFLGGVVVELIVEGWDVTITEDVAELHSNKVPEELIQDLRLAADELEEHNKSLK